MLLYSLGRIIFGAAGAAFGILCLAYRDFVSSLQPVPETMPGYTALAIVNGLLLFAAGLCVVSRYQIRIAATFIAASFASWILFLHIPGAFTNPELLLSPWWIRTFESLALGAAALMIAGTGQPARGAWVKGGRIAFGVSLPVFGVLHIIYPESTATLIPQWYAWPLFWAYFTGLAHITAGVAIAYGVLIRLAGTLAGIMFGLWALTLHLPRILSNPAMYQGDRPELTSLFVAVAFCGAAWIAGSTED